mmetsp:Transcript_4248/g.16924  ORF Transcript_4248/g.16924 Transcript_4248/m.16924 type:complete len:219 (+) Transcript_4248:3133-3789(+)
MVSFERFRLIAASTSCTTPNRDPTPLRLLAMPPKMPRCDTSAAAVACAAPITSSTALVELCTVERSRIRSSVWDVSDRPSVDRPEADARPREPRDAPPSKASRSRLVETASRTRLNSLVNSPSTSLCLASVYERASPPAMPPETAPAIAAFTSVKRWSRLSSAPSCASTPSPSMSPSETSRETPEAVFANALSLPSISPSSLRASLLRSSHAPAGTDI